MIFRLLGQSILLFTATDIIKQCPCTTASIIFFSSLLTNFSPNSGQVGVSTSHLLLMRVSPHTSPTRRFVGLQLCARTPIFSLPSQIHVFACCCHCSFACCWLCSCFTGSWVPSLAVFLYGFLGSDPGCFFFRSSLKLSPLTATRNLCRPRFVTTLDMMHCLLLKITDNS